MRMILCALVCALALTTSGCGTVKKMLPEQLDFIAKLLPGDDDDDGGVRKSGPKHAASASAAAAATCKSHGKSGCNECGPNAAFMVKTGEHDVAVYGNLGYHGVEVIEEPEKDGVKRTLVRPVGVTHQQKCTDFSNSYVYQNGHRYKTRMSRCDRSFDAELVPPFAEPACGGGEGCACK